jgi:hydrogenase maturation protease
VTLHAPILRLLVCGNADRGDDGAALRAVAHFLPRLEPAVLERIEVRRCQQLDPLDLIDVPEGEACVILDTVVGVPAGRVVALPLVDLATRNGRVTPRSSHALPIDQVLGVAAAVRGSLPAGMFVGIGGKWFGFGEVFSRAVRDAIPELEGAAEREIIRLVSATDPPAADAPEPAADPASVTGPA